MWLGSALTSRLITKVSLDRLLIRANALSVLAAFAFLVGVLTHHLSVPLIIGTMFLFTVGVGGASPAALTQAIRCRPAGHRFGVRAVWFHADGRRCVLHHAGCHRIQPCAVVGTGACGLGRGCTAFFRDGAAQQTAGLTCRPRVHSRHCSPFFATIDPCPPYPPMKNSPVSTRRRWQPMQRSGALAPRAGTNRPTASRMHWKSICAAAPGRA